MNVNVETSSSLRRKVTIELEPDEIARELDRSYAELRRSVHLKGFRPGRAPRQILERMFGDQVRAEVIQKLTREYTDRALSENDLKPVVAPEFVTEETDLKTALRFSAIFDIAPTLEVKDYKELKVPAPQVEVSDQQIDESLQKMREQMAPIKRVEDRNQVQDDDFVVVEMEAFEGEQPIAGSKMEPTLLKVGANVLAHGLHDLLVGVEKGVETRRRRAYPADYEEKDLAGKDVEWRIKVQDIFRAELAPLDDEFAKDQGDYASLAELREKVRRDLLVQARKDAQQRARDGLMDLILERNPVDVPQSLIEHELQALENEIVEALQARGMPAEQAREQAHKSHEELRPRALKRAHTALVVDAIAEQENVTVDDDELARAIGEIVSHSGAARDRAQTYYNQEENRTELRRALRREKAATMLFERALEQPAEEQAAETNQPASGGEERQNEPETNTGA